MTIDRRKFLAGTALGAVTAVFLDKQEAKAGNVSGYKARFAMIFDQNKCVGCGACKEACSETNHVPAGQLRMTLERQSPLDGTPGNRKYVRTFDSMPMISEFIKLASRINPAATGAATPIISRISRK